MRIYKATEELENVKLAMVEMLKRDDNQYLIQSKIIKDYKFKKQLANGDIETKRKALESRKTLQLVAADKINATTQEALEAVLFLVKHA